MSSVEPWPINCVRHTLDSCDPQAKAYCGEKRNSSPRGSGVGISVAQCSIVIRSGHGMAEAIKRRRRNIQAIGSGRRVSVTLDNALFARVETLAATKHESLSSVCSRAIEEYFNMHPSDEQLYLDLFGTNPTSRRAE